MATLTVRNVPEKTRDRLRRNAAKAGTSMEAEVRRILDTATAKAEQEDITRQVQEFVAKLYRGRRKGSAVDALIRERRAEARREQAEH